MHSSVQYMMVKMMVHNRNAERVDFSMMMIFFEHIVNVDVFSYQTITCSSLLVNNDVVNLCFFMWRESWTADWGRASEMPTVNCFLLLVTSIAISVLWQRFWHKVTNRFVAKHSVLFFYHETVAKDFLKIFFGSSSKKYLLSYQSQTSPSKTLSYVYNRPILNWHEEPWAFPEQSKK